MKIEIEITRCSFCKHFVFTDEKDMDFLNDDETYCNLNYKHTFVTDVDSCDSFELCEGILIDLKLDFGRKNVRVL